jgi:hypothetical protein
VLDFPATLKSAEVMVAVTVCLCLDEPSSFIIPNEALKVGDLELRFIKFHVPDTFHAGLPSGPFCMLEIVPF